MFGLEGVCGTDVHHKFLVAGAVFGLEGGCGTDVHHKFLVAGASCVWFLDIFEAEEKWEGGGGGRLPV